MAVYGNVWLTSRDMKSITGIKNMTLNRWVSASLLHPINANAGTGHHHLFKPIDAIAVRAGVLWKEWRNSYGFRQAPTEWVHSVVKLIAGMGLEQLNAEIDAGLTFPAPGCMVSPWYPSRLMDPVKELGMLTAEPNIRTVYRQLDMRTIRDEVLRKIVELKGDGVERDVLVANERNGSA